MKKMMTIMALLLGLVFAASGATILTEDFIKCSAGTYEAPNSTDIVSAGTIPNTYTALSGWTGLKVYQAGGCIKFGTSTASGYIITPTLNLSGNSGNATLTVDLSQFQSTTSPYPLDGTSVKVSHASDGTTFSQIGNDIALTNTLTNFTINITGGTANSKIKIEPTATGAKKRFYIDNLIVTQTLSGPYNIGTTGGAYTSLTGAGGLFSAINTYGVSGNITATIVSDLAETGATTLNNRTDSYTLTIQPETSTIKTISGNYAGALIYLNGADNVTIDGTAGKKLTITNNNTAGTVLALDNDANNNTITNCAITGSAMTGINIGNAPATTISQNKIYNLTGSGTNAVTGINFSGFATTMGNTIANNMIKLEPTTTGTVTGINYAGNALNSMNLYYNSVYIGGSNSTETYAFNKTTATNVMNIKNNLFYNTRTGGTTQYPVKLTDATGTPITEAYNLCYSANNNAGDAGTYYQSAAIIFSATPFANGELKFTNIYANRFVFNKGTPIAEIPTDFYGTSRDVNNGIPSGNDIPDIGAYEYAQPLGLDEAQIPATNSLSQNYPNPFNPATTIDFALAKEANINLTVYNTKGEVVKTLVNSNFKAGNHSVNFNANGLNSGVYIYKLSTPETSFTKKMILVK